MRLVAMNVFTDLSLSPDIVMGRTEHRQLLVLAVSRADNDEDADWLLGELERAMVVADHAVPPNVARMGSTVRYRSGGGEERTVELVFPKAADIGRGRISILTPIGAALIGLREGQSISYRTRDGRRSALTVLQVVDPPHKEDGFAEPA
jgi:regulator of nucleoside diphosphate kinase